MKLLWSATVSGKVEKWFTGYGPNTLLGEQTYSATLEEGVYKLENIRPPQGSGIGAWNSVKISITVDDSKPEGRLAMLAAALHSTQDAYAHEGGRLGHPDLAFVEYDWPWVNPGNALKAAERSYNALCQFTDTQNSKYTYRREDAKWVGFRDIQRFVLQYIRATNPASKKDYYQRIVNFLRTRGLTAEKPFRSQAKDYGGDASASHKVKWLNRIGPDTVELSNGDVVDVR